MGKIIVNDPQKKLPERWPSSISELESRPLSTAYGVLVWSTESQPEPPCEDWLERRWIVLLDKGVRRAPTHLPQVIALARAPWKLGWILSTIEADQELHHARQHNVLNHYLIREHERLLQQMKTTLAEKTEERRLDLETAQQKIRAAQARLIALNELISALFETQSDHDLTALLAERVPAIVSSIGQHSDLEKSVLEQIHSVTELVKHHKEQLQVAKVLSEEWSEAFDSMADPIALMDASFREIRSNRAYRQQLLSEHTNDEIRQLVNEVLSSTKTASKDIHFTNLDAWYFVRCIPVTLNNRPGATGAVLYFRDITAAREIRKHILQAEKLTDLGILAGSVAHEINNPLAGILAFIQLIQGGLAAGHVAAEDLKEMEKAALTCRAIVQNLLNFSRKANLEESGLVSIHQLFETIAPLIQLQLKHEHLHAHFHWSTEMRSVFITGSFSQFLQILLNLSTLTLDDAKRANVNVEFHWQAVRSGPFHYGIEVTARAQEAVEAGSTVTWDTSLVRMCRYVTEQLLKQNGGSLEEVKRDGVFGWRVVFPQANAHTPHTAPHESWDQT